MMASASSGTTSHTTCSMISRDSFAIASYSGPLAEIAASFCSTDALMVACAAGLLMRWRCGGAGGGVGTRWRGGGVGMRERVSSGIAGPVGCRGGGAAGGTACGADGMLGMLGMLGRMTPGIGMFAAGTPISVRPTGCAEGRGGAVAGSGAAPVGRTGAVPGRAGGIAPGRIPGISDGRIPGDVVEAGGGGDGWCAAGAA